MADFLDYYLGPTGIPDRLRLLNELLNPVVALSDAGQDLRRGDYVGSLANTASALVPVAGGRAAMKAAHGIPSLAPGEYDRLSSTVLEALTGVSERAALRVGQDIDLIRAVDSPDIVKDMFRDDEYAADVLGSLRDTSGFADAASMSDVQGVRDELYHQTQERLADLPDEITVYRAGDLNEADGVSSFTLNPSYNPSLNLPWNASRGSPGLEAYRVKKSEILASPDLIRDFGEGEVIIRNSSVRR